ncbi:AI-2E family transporter [bacterium]|jgi:predicted PurR-regulated permease PerM|nr:AI-2E family transporter [bacterium]
MSSSVDPKNNYNRFKEAFLDIVFSRDFLISFVLVVGSIGFLCLFWKIVAPFFIAFILAYLLHPMVLWWLRKVPRLGRAGSVGMVLFMIAAVILLAVIPFTLQLGSNVHSMAEEISRIDYVPIIKKVSSEVKDLKNMTIPEYIKQPVDQAVDYVFENVDQYQEKIGTTLKSINSFIGRGLKTIAGFLLRSSETAFKKTMDIFLILILLVYFLFDFPKVYPIFEKVVPPGYRAWVGRFMVSTDETLWSFIRGQGIVALIFGTLMSLGLWALGVKFWFVIGPLSGIANLVPFLGLIFGLGPALVLGIYQGAILGGVTGSLFMVMKVVILFVVVQFIDGNIVQPRIVGESVGLHPVIILLALFLGAALMGFYGLVFAVPVAAVLKVLVIEIYHGLYEDRSLLLEEGIREGE